MYITALLWYLVGLMMAVYILAETCCSKIYSMKESL